MSSRHLITASSFIAFLLFAGCGETGDSGQDPGDEDTSSGDTDPTLEDLITAACSWGVRTCGSEFSWDSTEECVEDTFGGDGMSQTDAWMDCASTDPEGIAACIEVLDGLTTCDEDAESAILEGCADVCVE